MNTTSDKHPCPVCGMPLAVGYDSNTRYGLYCGNGRCYSEAANQPAYGRTLDEAYIALRQAVIKEENEQADKPYLP